MTTGERIKEARIAAGLTQTELAEKVGLKFSAIHKYESGKVVNLKRETIAALATVLNVKPSWLMCLDNEDEESLALSAMRSVRRIEVSPKEERLLEYFRKASPELQEAALRMLEPAEKDNSASLAG